MTGKKSSFNRTRKPIPAGLHDFLYVLKKNYWLFPLSIIFFLVTIPFPTAGLPGDSIFEITVTHLQMKFRLIYDGMLPVVQAGCVVLGAVSGFSIFGFMHSKRDTTIFFSLGVTRVRLFVNRCACGALSLFAGIAVPMLISMYLNIKALGVYPGLIRNTVYITLGLFVTAAVCFLLAAAVSALAGTFAEALVYWCGILATPFAVCYALDFLQRTLLWGTPWGVTTYSQSIDVLPSLTETFSWMNPCVFFYGELKTQAKLFVAGTTSPTPYDLEPKALIGWGIAAALLFILSLVLVRARENEIAGIAGKSRVLSEWLTAVTSFFAFAGIFALLYEYDAKLSWIFGIAAAVAIHLFWRKSPFASGSGVKRSLCSLALGLVVFAAVCMTFATGIFHMTERFLDSGQIAQATVTYVGDPSYMYVTSLGSSTGRRYYVDGRATYENAEEISIITEIQKSFIESGRQPFETDEDDFSNTVVPYDVYFNYTDTDGKEHVWYYDRASLSQLEAFLSLEDTDTAKDGYAELFDGSLESADQIVWASAAYRQGEVYLTNIFCSVTYELNLTDDQREELLSAIAADRIESEIADFYFPEDQAAAVLMFSRNGAYDCQNYAFNLNNAFVYVHASSRNTYAWLENNNLLDLVSETPVIESVSLQKLDPYIGINDMTYPMNFYFMSYRSDNLDSFMITKDFGSINTITNEEKLSALVPKLQNGYYMSDGGYLAAVKVKGTDGYVYMFLPARDVPEFVRG